jgi:hypothetical protein
VGAVVGLLGELTEVPAGMLGLGLEITGAAS